MATTKSTKYALEYAKRFVKQIPTDGVAVDIANAVHSKIWNAGNWVWTVNSCEVSLTPTSLGTSQQDYNLSSNLTDYSRFIQGTIQTLALTGGIRTDSLTYVDPVSYIPSSSLIKGIPSCFQYIPGGTDKIRFNSTFEFTTGSKFYGVYKKAMTLLTNKTINELTQILLPDDWYYVLQEGVLYHFYKYADDDRAGTSKTNSNGQEEFTGQLAVFMEALNDMKQYQPILFLDYTRGQDRKE